MTKRRVLTQTSPGPWGAVPFSQYSNLERASKQSKSKQALFAPRSEDDQFPVPPGVGKHLDYEVGDGFFRISGIAPVVSVLMRQPAMPLMQQIVPNFFFVTYRSMLSWCNSDLSLLGLGPGEVLRSPVIQKLNLCLKRQITSMSGDSENTMLEQLQHDMGLDNDPDRFDTFRTCLEVSSDAGLPSVLTWLWLQLADLIASRDTFGLFANERSSIQAAK
ncbi:hypothetical protein BKA70DRAFT_1235423 [Coprinopsis sp. MPI-PUGE-AT-0042]|nr:hypothetical protein BKA70DRAFT_1235423 [Coprinopsis sp. MPI-PUGE-AT-0042]